MYLAFPTQNQLFIHHREQHKKPPKAPSAHNGVQDASQLHSWCSKEKLEEIKADLLMFRTEVSNEIMRVMLLPQGGGRRATPPQASGNL